MLNEAGLSVDKYRVEMNHIRHTSLLPVVNTDINEKDAPKMNVRKLTQAGHNGDAFLDKDILHCCRKHAIEAENLI